MEALLLRSLNQFALAKITLRLVGLHVYMQLPNPPFSAITF